MQPAPITLWHQAVSQKDLGAFEDILDDAAVFQSPAVHAPQAGKALVAGYLRAALAVLNTDSFRYVDEWFGERSAVLEFAVTLDGVDIEGVDIIRWNEAGRVTNFKVMVRPLKALNTVVALMGAQLKAVAP
jgi:hypothetical protein